MDSEGIVRNQGSIFKNFCNTFLKPKKIPHDDCCMNTGQQCQDNSFKRLWYKLIQPNQYSKQMSSMRPKCVCTAVQSRKYEGLQERAGKEVFCRNKATSGVPKHMFRKPEEYDVYVVEEMPRCVQLPTIVNKEGGLDTKCNVNLGWYKDSHAYGEPKPQTLLKNMKTKVGTQMGASFKTDTSIGYYNTNATQSRNCRDQDVRTGRATYYKERQTSCIPKTQKAKMEGDCSYGIIKQPVQSSAPDRKSISFGSDCSFCFEFYKDLPSDKPEISCPKPNNEPIGNKNDIMSKFYRQRQAINNSDACTCTEELSSVDNHKEAEQKQGQTTVTNKSIENDNTNINKPIKDEHDREKKCKGKPLHIGSKVNFDFRFFKTIPPPKETHLSQKEKKCSCDVLHTDSDLSLRVPSPVDTQRAVSTPSVCEPCVTKRDDDGPQSEHFSGSPLKKNLFRIIMGKIRNNIKTTCNMTKTLKYEPGNRVCDPPKCYKRNQGNESWFSYILSNIQQTRQPSTSTEYELKRFFSDILSNPSNTTTQSSMCKKRCGPRKCKYKLKQGDDGWFTYILNNIKNNKKPIKNAKSDSGCFSYILNNLKEKKSIADSAKSNAESFFSQLLAEDLSRIRPCSCNRKKRRRRRRTKLRSVRGIPRSIGGSSSFTESTPLSPTPTTEGDCNCTQPCRIRSEFCLDANYKTLQGTESSQSQSTDISDCATA